MKRAAVGLSLALMGSYVNAFAVPCTEQAITQAQQSYIDSLPAPEGLCGSAEYNSNLMRYSISLVEQSCGTNSKFNSTVELWKQSLQQSEEAAANFCVN